MSTFKGSTMKQKLLIVKLLLQMFYYTKVKVNHKKKMELSFEFMVLNLEVAMGVNRKR